MGEKLRNSGIDIIGNVPWGTHFCQFYQTKKDLIDILVPYFKAGLESNEFCIWVTSQPVEVEEAKEALKRDVPDFDIYLKRGQIEIFPYTHGYINEGVFDPETVINGWGEKLKKALDNGYEGLRATGDTCWLEKEGWSDFVDYENKIDSIIEEHPMIALCPYHLGTRNAAEILDIAFNHQFSLIKRVEKWERIENFGRRRAEKATVQAAKDWEQTFDAVPDLIAILDTEFRVVRANKSMALRLGVTPEECVGLTCYRVMHGTGEPPSFCPHKQVLENGLEYITEVHEDVLGGDFVLSVSPIYDPDGKVTGCVHVARDITERKRAEKALKESDERERVRSNELEVILDAVPAAVWITHDPKALQITGNRLSYEWLRIPEGTNASKSAPEGERPETFKIFKDGVELQPEEMPVQTSAAGTEINNYEFDLVYPDGTMRYILGNAKPLCDEQGEPKGSISAFIDITERKKAEEALKRAHESLEEKIKERTSELEEAYKLLKESENSLAEAQKIAHLGNWEWDIAADKAYWSEEMYRIFGRSPQKSAPKYKEYLSCAHPDDQENFDNFHKKAVAGKPYSLDHRIVLTNGEERTIHIRSEVVYEGDTPVKLKGIVQDITERKKDEEQIQSLANIVESSNDAIITISLDGIITSWNKGAEQIYGYLSEEIIGKSASLPAPDHLKRETKQLIEKVKQGEDIRHYETTRIRKDGKAIYISIALSPVCDTYGKLVAISAITRDISKRIEIEKSLMKIEEARIKEIHHRIKNNLQVISSLLDLQAEKFNDKEVLEAFRESHSRVLSMSLIHEELYRGEGNDKLDFSAYLQKLAEKLFQTYSLTDKNIQLSMNLEERAFFDIDIAIPLGIIVNELVSNSLKHAFPEKEGEIRVHLRREERNNEADKSLFSLTISDNGIGIPKDVELASFDSLGLKLVNTLVDQLDGEVKLIRVQGTKFRITFKVMERSQ